MQSLPDDILNIIYPAADDKDGQTELHWSSVVDKAHLLMLGKQGLIDQANVVTPLLKEIENLEKDHFEVLKKESLKRGLYIAYETHLIDHLGMDVAGHLQTGRSRNDLFATVFRLHNRQMFKKLVPDILSIQRTLLGLAEKHKSDITVVHTQMQPAMYGTFGHHFTGFAASLSQHIETLLPLLEMNEISPLGSGAATGTSLPIDPEYTAALLGFSSTVTNSLQGVAHYEFVITLMGAFTGYLALLDRLATTLHLWSTQEYNYISFEAALTGASSMLPQKRNPFLLEVIKARIAKASSLLEATVTGMLKVPFSNAMETKAAAKTFWSYLDQLEEILTLTQFTLSHLKVNSDKDYKIPAYDGCKALHSAEELVRDKSMPFREAYSVIAQKGSDHDTDPAEIVEAFKYGHGPATEVTTQSISILSGQLTDAAQYWQIKEEYWQDKDNAFNAKIKEHVG